MRSNSSLTTALGCTCPQMLKSPSLTSGLWVRKTPLRHPDSRSLGDPLGGLVVVAEDEGYLGLEASQPVSDLPDQPVS